MACGSYFFYTFPFLSQHSYIISVKFNSKDKMYLLLVIGPALPSSPFSEVHSLVGSFSKGSRKQWFRIRTVSRHFLTLAVVLTGYDILGSHFLSLGVPLLVKSVAVNTPLVIWHFFPCKWHGFFFFLPQCTKDFLFFFFKIQWFHSTMCQSYSFQGNFPSRG